MLLVSASNACFGAVCAVALVLSLFSDFVFTV